MKLLRQILVIAALMTTGLLAGLILIEAGFRIVMAKTPAAKSWNDRPEFYFADEKASTLQDFAHSETKPENTFRIAVVGDSYSFAPYMQFTDAFPKVLERMLNLNDVSLKAEVINYGVPAYSSSHEIAIVERAVKENADLVMLQITLNDPELKPYRPTGINTNLPDRFGSYEATGWKATLFKYWKTAGFVAQRIHNTRTHENYKKYFIDLFEEPRTWNPFVASVRKIQEIAKQNNKPLVAIVMPLFGLPLDENYPFRGIHEKVGGLLKELGIPFVDLYAPFEGIPLERIQVIPGEDRHPNEIAHRMCGEAIYDWLIENRLVPDVLAIRKKYKTRIGIVNQPEYGDAK